MPGRLVKADDVGRELKRLLAADLADAGAGLADVGRPREARIHTARRRLKRARSLLRVFGPYLGADHARRRAALRETAAELSRTRDLDVMAATAAALADHAPAKLRPAIAEIATRLADEAAAAHETGTPVAAVIERLRAAERETEALAAPDDGIALFETEFGRAYQAARKAMAAARTDRTEQCFHAWRKRVKHHFHLARMARGAGTSVTGRVVGELDELGDLLGAEHDHAVLAARLLDNPMLAGDGRAADRILGLIDTRRDKLQAKALKRGRRLYANRPKTARAGLSLG